jgi:peptidoglycan/LPS O-acetylase OafA/YrhL
MAEPPGERPYRLGYRPVLDGVRAVAILSVLAFHFRANDTAVPTRGGFLGVDIFFVLSGFLITSLLLEELAERGTIRFRSFYARRALRLLPALFATVAAVVVYSLTLGPAGRVGAILRDAGAALTYWENWHEAFSKNSVGTMLGHTWSLSIEEQFYILWPALLLGLVLLGRKRLALGAVWAGVVAIALERALRWHGGASVQRLFMEFDTRADSLLLGCALAFLVAGGYLSRGRGARLLRLAFVPGVLVVFAFLVFAYNRSAFMYLGGFTLFALAVAVVLGNLATRDVPLATRLLETRPMVWTGRVSYGIYLWHFPILWMLRDHLHKMHLVDPIAAPLVFVVAALSFRYVESPFLRLKSRLRKAPAAGAPAPEPRPAELPAPALEQVG